MTMESSTQPIWVNRNEDLKHLCLQWSHLSVLALDTEFVRVDTFYPRIGLLQVCDGSSSYLLDPLALNDWEDFKALLGNNAITKVLHSCSEDLLVFQDFFKQLPLPVFDTQRAAAFLGFGYSISYQNLVHEMLGLPINKEQTRSDWLRRPLSEEQMQYAALDVTYLPVLAKLLKDTLEEQGRLEWVAHECEQMLAQSLAVNNQHLWKLHYLNIAGAWRLSSEKLATLQKLCIWREIIAREKDKPRSWIAKDTDLLILADAKPAQRNELFALEQLSRHVPSQYGELLLKVINSPTDVREINPDLIEQPFDAEMRKLLKKLQKSVKEHAESLGIAPELLARKKQLIPLVSQFKRTGETSWPQELEGWRRSIIEPSFMAILSSTARGVS